MNSTLLHIDTSPRFERSQSRALGADFLAAWKAKHPEGTIETIDLTVNPPPFVSTHWVEGAFTPPESHSPAARAAIATSNAYVDQLLRADQVLITTPIFNLSVPAALKAWIDQIVRVGRTFGFAPGGGFEGLAKGRKVTVIVSSGSDLRPGTPGEGYNFIEPYLRAVMGFIGITDVTFVYAHSMNHDTAKAEIVASAKQQLAALAAA